MTAPRWWQDAYTNPLPSGVRLFTQQEMVRRIEWFRSQLDIEAAVWPDPIPLPIGRICEPAFLVRRSA